MPRRPLAKNAPIWARRVTLLCKQRDIPRSRLAEVMGASLSAVGHYFTGRVQPSFEQLFVLASFLNVSLDSLLRADEDHDLSAESAREYQLRVPLIQWDEVGIARLTPPDKSVIAPCDVSDFAFAVRVESHDAAPVFIAGDTILTDYRGTIPTSSFVLWRANEHVQPEIKLYVSSQAGKVLYPVDPTQEPTPVVIDGPPLFMQKIVAKVTLY